MAADSPLRAANEALRDSSRNLDDHHEQGGVRGGEAIALGFAEAIAWALLDVAVSQRILSGREIQW